ncbi:MAG TPA: BrnT family toxin [Candidatus Latescibacteria bacterium]|nr:BrnT family toxin [Candidatus Latescibacterota bacterium]
MRDLSFEWDDGKDAENRQKHGVSFEEARTVFCDDFAVQCGDEDRFVLLGSSAKLRMLLVCHCERSGGSTIRIISARKATGKERSLYPSGRK